MKFVYQDLLKFLTKQPSRKDLSRKLYQLGHEHEIDGDIFDMEITPNRGDCLSLFGLSRDLNNFYNFKDPFEVYDEDIEELDLNFINLSIDSCPKISFLEIEIDQKISSYQPYLENYFSELKNNKTNFFTDISNYISYERGQPTHCFDKELLGGEITFDDRPCQKHFKTLLGDEIKLKDHNCIFISNEEIISLAGVMGGESTACSNKTKKVLIECAYFNPEAIIGKTIKYNLKSDAAHKFERGVDISSQEKVLRRFIKVVSDHASIKSIKMKTFGTNPKERFLPMETERINKILGSSLSKKEYVNYLSKLGFEIGDKIKIPLHRHDISSQNDLSEEIARVLGYDNIKTLPLEIRADSENEQTKISMIEDFFVQNGFSEVINFPFTEIEEKKSILIDNPLDSNRKNLRTSLKDSLIKNLLFNERRQKDSIKLFEISDVYSNETNIIQEKKLGVIISGRLGHNHEDFQKKLDENFLNKILNLNNEISIFNIEEISRDNIKTKKKEKIFYTEILVDDIPDQFFKNCKSNRNLTDFVRYSPVSDFPSSIRDFSFSVKDPKQYDNVISHIGDFRDKNLKDFFIFDFYLNKKINEIKIGVRLIFQSNFNTLSDDEIKKSTQKLLRPLIDLEGVSIPGLDKLI